MADRNVTPGLASQTCEDAAAAVTVPDTTPQAAPVSGGSEGIDCEGYTHAVVGLYRTGGALPTDYSVELWGKIGDEWFQITDSAGAVIDLDLQTARLGLTVMIAGYSRLYVRVDAITAGAGASSIKVLTRLFNLLGA